MKTIYSSLTFLFCLASFVGTAQEIAVSSPLYEGTVSSVEYVTSISSRPADMIPADQSPKEAKDKRALNHQISASKSVQDQDDYFVENRHEMEASRSVLPPSLVFDAYSSGSQPTDPSLAVGPNHVMVVFNTGFAIYDKSGNQLQGPTSPNPAIFPSGGCCDLTASYDNAADRWVLSFLGSGAQVAVSDGPNPLTAGWFIYTISAINDYQKLSIWSDGYYMTDNTSSTNKVWALERSAMLNGDANAQIIGFNLPGISTSGFYSPQALNVIDGNMPAAGGATIVYMQDDAWSGVSSDHIKLWTIDVDWNTTSNSTISTAQQISVTPFISVFDNGSFSNLAQPGGGSSIDALQATIMNQAQFMKFTSYNSAVFNFVVDADASSGELAAVRWMEFRQSGDNQPWSLYQEGTYTAPDGRHAWNASMAIDGNGNIGMGYSSMSGPSTPSTVRVSSYYTGRLSSDPLGTMTSEEGLIANGNQNFSGTRYGDYCKLDVDPANGTDFWFITEYMNSGRKGVVGVFELDSTPPPVDNENPSDPSNLVASNITSSSAQLNWNASTDNIGVTHYNISIDGSVVGISSSTDYVVTGLSPLTTYTASVNAQDAAGNTSGNVSTSFTTTELVATYCTSTSSNVNDEYISRVQLNTLDNSSGAQFYSDFTSQSTGLTEGQSYTVSVTPTWTGTIYAEGYAVWIDYNNDIDFDDAGELVWSKSASTDTPNSGTFTVPAGISQGATRMRVSMMYNGVPTACQSFTYGEVEDYTVVLSADAADTQAPSDPSNLVASNITTSSAQLNWNASTDNVGVTQYTISIDGSVVGTSGSTNFGATGLSPSTTYTASVTAEDAAGNTSGSASTSFTTSAVTPTYCSSTSSNVNDEYISRVQLNTLDNSSGAQFYSDFTSLSTGLTEGATYTVTVTPTWPGTVYSEGYAVWIDYNNDFDFADAGELVWSKAASTDTPSSGSFTVPSNTAQGATRMRVSMMYNGIPTACQSFTYGEVEDYTVVLDASVADTQAPTTPTNLSTSNETTTSIDLTWSSSTDNVGVAGYTVYLDGVSIGTVSGNTASITSLTPSTTYDFNVSAYDAAGNNSAQSNTATGTTLSDGGSGPGVIAAYYFETGLEGWLDGGSDCARVATTAYSYEGGYSVRLRDNSSSSNMRSPILDLSGNAQVTFEFHSYARSMESGEDFFIEFYNGSSYEVIGNYARGADFNNNSFFSPAAIVLNASDYNFNANNRFRIRNDASTNNDRVYFDQIIISGDNVPTSIVQINDNLAESVEELRSFSLSADDNVKIYPNPAKTLLNIEITDADYDQIMIFSMTGKHLHSERPGADIMRIDVSDYIPGMYFIRFVANGKATTKRFIIE